MFIVCIIVCMMSGGEWDIEDYFRLNMEYGVYCGYSMLCVYMCISVVGIRVDRVYCNGIICGGVDMGVVVGWCGC